MFEIHKSCGRFDNKVFRSKPFDLYTYTCYAGEHNPIVENGDSLWTINARGEAKVTRGTGNREYTSGMGVVMRGYQCDEKTSSIQTYSNLPYVNGCSTHQIFPPVRAGDPTLQLLYLPPHTAEQAHHIHSTVRCVYVLEGEGYSVQGMKDDVEVKLEAGDVIVLDKMTPHHFRTEGSHLVVVPFHVYSSTVLEHSHPMKDGTHII